MKIGFFSGGYWAKKAIERITSNPNFEIVFIVPRDAVNDIELIETAREFNIEVINCGNVNSISAIEEINQYKADLFISLSFNQIIKPVLLQAAPYGFINFHAGNYRITEDVTR